MSISASLDVSTIILNCSEQSLRVIFLSGWRYGSVDCRDFSERGKGLIEIVRAADYENLNLVGAQMRLGHAQDIRL
jgi:hypothetical protein